MSERYPLFFEKMIARCIANLKALLPLEGNPYHTSFDYLKSLRKSRNQTDKYDAISNANGICLKNGVNAVFANRASILVFPKRKPGMVFPHNHGSTEKLKHGIDSS